MARRIFLAPLWPRPQSWRLATPVAGLLAFPETESGPKGDTIGPLNHRAEAHGYANIAESAEHAGFEGDV